MSVTTLTEVANQIQEFWSPMFMAELREKLMLGALVNKDYDGEIKQGGDTVYVSQINAPQGELKTVGVDADSFNTEALSTSRIAIEANKRAVAAYEFHDLVQLQSQIGQKDSEIRKALMFAVEKQVNSYLYDLVAPSTSAPDHVLSGITDFNASQLLAVRLLASQAKWLKEKGWWVLMDPSYYNDILSASTLTSSDYVGDDAPVVSGQIAKQRFGFNILEDDSLSTDQALAFHPDFMHLVMQRAPQFKVSDLHSNKKFGYVISVDMIFGAKLGIAGDRKHIEIYNSVALGA